MYNSSKLLHVRCYTALASGVWLPGKKAADASTANMPHILAAFKIDSVPL